MGQFKNKWLKMVTRMYWIFAYMAFIMFQMPGIYPGKEVFDYLQQVHLVHYQVHFQLLKLVKENFCEEAGGTLAAHLNNHEFHTIFLRNGHFFRKGGVLWIGAIYDINERDGNRWTWPNFVTIKDIKTSKPTDQDELCGVMDAQLNNGRYEPFIRGHSCDEWSPNTGVLCMRNGTSGTTHSYAP